MGRVFFGGGKVDMKAPISGVLASTLAVGSSVYLMENGSAVEYLVVNQGIPGGSSLYDASCDGTWLLRKDIYEKRQWHSSNTNKYASSDVHSYLNGTFFELYGGIEQTAINQVKIPYCVSGGSSVNSGTNGLSTKVFLLSGYEIGFTTSVSSYFPVDGAKLDYFESGDTSGGTNRAKRIAYLNGTAALWWLRSPMSLNSTGALLVGAEGAYGSYGCSSSYGIRPALILPSTALFDKNTMVLKGVS